MHQYSKPETSFSPTTKMALSRGNLSEPGSYGSAEASLWMADNRAYMVQWWPKLNPFKFNLESVEAESMRLALTLSLNPEGTPKWALRFPEVTHIHSTDAVPVVTGHKLEENRGSPFSPRRSPLSSWVLKAHALARKKEKLRIQAWLESPFVRLTLITARPNKSDPHPHLSLPTVWPMKPLRCSYNSGFSSISRQTWHVIT
jgi:hypothetical protein